MTQLLPILLKTVEHAGASERKELANKIDKNLYYGDKPVRELILSDSTQSTSLIQTEVYRTIIEGANPAVAMREAVDSVQMNSEVIRINKGSAGVYAPLVTGGAEIPIHTNDYDPAILTSYKYARRPMITNELVNDALFDVINDEIKYLGQSLENRLNYEVLGTMLEGSGNEHDTTGSDQGIKAIAAGRVVQMNANWMPTDLIMCPEADGSVMSDYLPTTANFQVGDSTTSGKVPVQVMGMASHTVGTTTSSGTYTWGYGANSEIGMLLHDRSRSARLGMREDITIKQFDDPIHDLAGIVGQIRFGSVVLNSTAITRIEY